MKYIADSMLDGLEDFMAKRKVDFVTAKSTLLKSNDSGISIPDGRLFRFALEKKFELVPREGAEEITIITSDNELPGYCKEFGIGCIHVRKPDTSKEFDQMAAELAERLSGG